MHGRPREYKNKFKDPKFAEAHEKKVATIRAATTAVLECRKQRRYDEAALGAAAKLLKVVPEIYTVWNYRKEALQPVLDAGGEAAVASAHQELALTQACLIENPKSYAAWHHRKWVASKLLTPLSKELALVTGALQQDERNFHAWDYRQFVSRLMGRSPEEELQYTEEKIIENFSNYSAWHYRSVLLQQQARIHMGLADKNESEGEQTEAATPSTTPNLGGTGEQLPIDSEVLHAEYDMIHQAFATDSCDQSPWMYYRWLLGNSLAGLKAAQGTDREESVRDKVTQVLERELDHLHTEHLAHVPDAKWPLLATAWLKEAQEHVRSTGSALPADGHVANAKAEIYKQLMHIDPMRSGYYKDALSGRAGLLGWAATP